MANEALRVRVASWEKAGEHMCWLIDDGYKDAKV